MRTLASRLSLEPPLVPSTSNALYDAKFKLVDLRSGTGFGDSGEFTYSFQVTAVPEPASFALVGLPMAGYAVRRFRKKRSPQLTLDA